MTEITRRSLLRTGATATAVAMVGVRPWDAATASAAAVPVGPLRRSDYAGLTATDFAVVDGPAGARLTLASVSDVAGAAHSVALRGSEDAFVLAFSGDAGLDSGIHTLEHARLGRFELFVSPVGAQAQRGYEAVIDRSVGAPPSPPRGPEPTTSEPARDEPTAAAARALAPAAAATAGTSDGVPAGVPAAGTPSSPKRAVAPLRSPQVLRKATVRRRGRGARVDLALLPAVHAKTVRVALARGGRTVARATHAVRDRRAAVVLRTASHLPAGRYTLSVTAVTAAGEATTQRLRITVR
ncbi:MAG TPA: hypothetical protein VFG42_23410 [Baekduia sp.]|uniref:DUF6916 family protein n=1 Tax=Baekduia sp. TaxID=2600305 RepID=UPI002D78A069|nr:hypothetical protein [Baekduia sp.]HET6509761.1 hypothetical protein [Baekduia sp.]